MRPFIQFPFVDRIRRFRRLPSGRDDAGQEQRCAASRPGTFGNKISIAGLAYFAATSTTLTITSKKAIER
jgi:hypothetical protein